MRFASAVDVQGSIFDVSTRPSAEALIPLPSRLPLPHLARRRGNNLLAQIVLVFETCFDRASERSYSWAVRNVAAALLVFLGGFAIMVLEIIGARFLAKDFGGSFYVWVSQIGVILIALALGYWVGGALADRFRRISFLAYLLAPAGVVTVFIPDFAEPLMDVIIQRHPADREIPLVWQKLDPALGSALIFLLPCFALATLPPYMIRLATRRLTHVGRISGLIIAASTVGSIAGVFVSGYVLIDQMKLSHIFRGTGGLMVLLGALCFFLHPWFGEGVEGGRKPERQ